MKWIERKFEFDFPVSVYPGLIERICATPDRLEGLVKSLPQEILVRREGEKWSIQEIAGHLLSADELFAGRLDDYESGAGTLRPADVSGRRTEAENYNQGNLLAILARFRSRRGEFVARLRALKPGDFGRTAMHPRLNEPMRLCDMLFFQAEHDDHHLAGIEELIRRFQPAS
jgi:uncharacterized damage-inducible protein DinB